jgi:hypothetical protein
MLTAARARTIVAVLARGGTNAEAARRAGVSARTPHVDTGRSRAGRHASGAARPRGRARSVPGFARAMASDPAGRLGPGSGVAGTALPAPMGKAVIHGRALVNIGEVQVLRATGRALLVLVLECGQTVWIPKSLIADESEVDGDVNSEPGCVGTMMVSRWLAEENDL